MLEANSYTLYAWIQSKKTKIGYATHNAKYNCLCVKADPHLDATKIGRLLMKGEIQIDAGQGQRKQIATEPAEEFDVGNYQSAADAADAVIDARQAEVDRQALKDWE